MLCLENSSFREVRGPGGKTLYSFKGVEQNTTEYLRSGERGEISLQNV